MTGKEILTHLSSQKTEELFSSLYGADGVNSAVQRYRRLIEELLDEGAFPRQEFSEADGELRVFSVPGRTELGGNHTDHNRGKVLAASIQLDAAAIIAPRQDNQIFFRSTGHRDVIVDISDLSIREEEKGDTEALVRGIAAEFTAQGTPVKGFTANADNMVLSGSGLSSSAALEVLLANIDGTHVPLSVLEQYMPIQYTHIREGRLKAEAAAILKDRVKDYIDDYLFAVMCH